MILYGVLSSNKLLIKLTGNSLCSSFETRPIRTRCKELALHCRQGKGPYLESLTKNIRGDLRLTPWILKLRIQRIWRVLYSNWKGDISSIQRGLSCFVSDWNWSTASSSTLTTTRCLKGRFLLHIMLLMLHVVHELHWLHNRPKWEIPVFQGFWKWAWTVQKVKILE